MGYSHYLWRPRKLDPEKFKLVVRDFRRAAEAVAEIDGLEIAGWDGTGSPEVGLEFISFNGVEREGEAFETMRVDRVKRNTEWQDQLQQDLLLDFCKTGRKPYDILVVALLLIVKYHYQDEVVIKSDGGPGDLQPGWMLCQRILGYSKQPVMG